MDSLHTMLRSIRGETKARPNHLTVFREFLDELERISRRRGRRAGTAAPSRRGKSNGARKGKR